MSGGGSAFEQAVMAVLLALVPGEVVTYGEVAEEAGYPGRARAVGHLLARGPGPAGHRQDDVELPWWRVVAANGRLVPGLEAEHAQRLAAEGVPTGSGRVAGMAEARRLRRNATVSGRVGTHRRGTGSHAR